MVLVRLPESDVELLTHRSTANPQHKITINLEDQTVTDDQGFSAHFDIDPFRKYCLLNGLDDIGLTLRHAPALDAYESTHNAEFWLQPRNPQMLTPIHTEDHEERMPDQVNPKHYSIPLTEGPNRAGARAMLRSIGFAKDDLHKPIIGVANTWTEIGPCNFHLRDVAAAVKEGIREAGGTPMEFNTVTISDGITMGTQGMKASLISREVIADSIELVARGNLFDGIVCIAGCDKNMPGAIMALARLDIPGLMLYGGSIAPGHLRVGADGKPTTETAGSHLVDITIQNVFEAIGSHAAGRITDAQLEAVEATACPGPGACGGQFTANTMAMAGEFLGISPMLLTGVPAMDPHKHEASRAAGRMVMDLARSGLTSRKVLTREALENAITAVCASGGSTNAVLHLIAIARELSIPLDILDFDRISERTPFICDLSPGGKYVASDYQAAGGSRVLAARLIEKGLLHA
jgi:dihydroxy-acid dehydratase